MSDRWYRIMDISMYNGKRFAIAIDVGGRARVLYGTGAYVVDRDLGRVLKVRLQNEDGSWAIGRSTLVLQEEFLRERLLPSDRDGCDGWVDLGSGDGDSLGELV
jgi:hypothetical protein